LKKKYVVEEGSDMIVKEKDEAKMTQVAFQKLYKFIPEVSLLFKETMEEQV